MPLDALLERDYLTLYREIQLEDIHLGLLTKKEISVMEKELEFGLIKYSIKLMNKEKLWFLIMKPQLKVISVLLFMKTLLLWKVWQYNLNNISL